MPGKLIRSPLVFPRLIHPNMARAVAAAGALTTLSIRASATSTAATITGPASITAGDLLVLWDMATNAATLPTSVIPTGFTSIVDFTVGSVRKGIASYKIANGSEASASLTGMNGNTTNDKALYVVQGNQAIASATPTDVGSEGTTGNPVAQTVTSGSGAAPLIVFGCYGSSGIIDPRTFTVGGVGAKDGEINPDTDLYLAYKIYNSSPADVVVDMDDEGTNIMASFYIACA